VSGHGMPAALITMTIKELFVQNGKKYNDPSKLLKFFNTELSDLMKNYDSYFTAFYLLIEKNKILYSNALHPPGYLIKNNETYELGTGGYLIGISDRFNPNFKTEEYEISKGDKIILMTDGISESMDKNNDRFGEKKMKNLLFQNNKLNYKELQNLILESKEIFSSHTSKMDDETLIILEIK
jgi:serine phosphatase RsbU (regulator of sigma subunit)